MAALLHHLDEARRHQYPGLGVPPAHERLDAEDAPRAEVDDRLIFEEELLLSERAPNIRLEAQALLQQVLHLRPESDVTALPGRLGVVHRDVRVAEQRLGSGLAGGVGDADARRDPQRLPVERERRLQFLDQRPGAALHLRDRGDSLQQHGELVSPEPRDRIGGAAGRDDPLGHVAQKTIAGVVTEGIVDVLEVIEVEEHHRNAALVALRESQRVVHAIPEQAAIGELGEGVLKRQLPQLRLERLAFADVAKIEGQPLHRRITGEIGADALRKAMLRAAPDTELHGTDRSGMAGGDLGQERLESFAVLSCPELGEVPSDDLVGLRAQHALARGRGETQDPLRTDNHDHVRSVGDERGVSILREAQYHALTCHEEQHEGEHHGAGRARRAAAVAEIHVDHHDERGEHRGRGKNTGESTGSFRPCTGRRCGKVSQLLASGGGHGHETPEIQDVVNSSRQVGAAHLGERPGEVAEEQDRKSAQEQRVDARPARIFGSGEQQHAEQQQHDAVERDVRLTQAFLEEVDFGVQHRVDHEEPEERAETRDEDQRVHCQLHPRHAQGGGAHQIERRGRDGRIERTEEEVSRTRERFAVHQPGSGSDSEADEIQRERNRKTDPGAAAGTWRCAARRGDGDDQAREGGGEHDEHPQPAVDRRSADPAEQALRARDRVDHEREEQPVHPTRKGWDPDRSGRC